ncbi:hypothetical protein [Halobacteriovorax sp. HLS]|jgi:hypothetical protein|nr:hypothetical protein [Halobacteriovorax sp. HLS]
MKKTTKEIKHYFREILGTLSVKEIMSNNQLIARATRIERLIVESI